MNSLALLTNQALAKQIKILVRNEQKLAAEIVEYIKEADRRQLYRDFGYNSLYAYLTEHLGYTPGSARRRIDAARLIQEIPEVKADIASGSLNLMQVSILAQSVRQKKKEEPASPTTTSQKRDLIEQIKNQSLASTQKIVAQGLDVKPKTIEKQAVQKDESVRLELTLTKEQMAQLKRVKDLISHKYPSMSLVELIEYLADNFLKRKDPLRKPCIQKTPPQTASKPPTKPLHFELPAEKTPPMISSRMNVMTKVLTSAPESGSRSQEKSTRRLSAETRRWVFQKYRVCQWRDPKTNRLCGSQFQLQIDHIKPVWAGGGDERSNLHLLCSFHNRQKYRGEARIRRSRFGGVQMPNKS